MFILQYGTTEENSHSRSLLLSLPPRLFCDEGKSPPVLIRPAAVVLLLTSLTTAEVRDSYPHHMSTLSRHPLPGPNDETTCPPRKSRLQSTLIGHHKLSGIPAAYHELWRRNSSHREYNILEMAHSFFSCRLLGSTTFSHHLA